MVRRRVEEVLGVIGLGEYIDRMRSELSSAQRRRVAIARAMAARLEHVTSIVVTHQIRDAFSVTTQEAVRTTGGFQIVPADEGKTDRADFMVPARPSDFFEGTAAQLLASRDAYLREFPFITLPPWVAASRLCGTSGATRDPPC